MNDKTLMSTSECIRGFCKAMGLSRVTKLVLTVQMDEPVKLEVTTLPPESALSVFLRETYQFELKEVPGSGKTIIEKVPRWYGDKGMTISADVIADSISPLGIRITTMALVYPRFIHAELMTHRVFSRNASSSRATPIKRMLSEVWKHPATPIHWGANQAGMQARTELSGIRMAAAALLWKWTGRVVCVPVWLMSKLGLHKQVANRLLEPWQHINVVVTATDWDNFYNLRCHPDAQPEIQELARAMRAAQVSSTPRRLQVGEWHLPYVSATERAETPVEATIKISVARCCRVSYMNHGGKLSTKGEDILLYNRLVEADPPHMSPLEHQAQCAPDEGRYANFSGWISHRYQLESEAFTLP